MMDYAQRKDLFLAHREDALRLAHACECYGGAQLLYPVRLGHDIIKKRLDEVIENPNSALALVTYSTSRRHLGKTQRVRQDALIPYSLLNTSSFTETEALVHGLEFHVARGDERLDFFIRDNALQSRLIPAYPLQPAVTHVCHEPTLAAPEEVLLSAHLTYHGQRWSEERLERLFNTLLHECREEYQGFDNRLAMPFTNRSGVRIHL